MGNRPIKPGWITAKTADIHDLYERAVQCPESEVNLILQAWDELRGRRPSRIREDFCGTSAVAREWVCRNENNTVLGVDLDAKVLAWAQNKIERELTEDQCRRVSLVRQDVMHVDADPVECILAMNFSYYGFKDRKTLKEYFSAVRGDLLDGGVFLLDAYGGSDSFIEMDEERDLDGFTYIWDQHHVNPINGDIVNYIHFEFPNGSKLHRAFTYRWRFWTLPEIRDVLLDAGFSSVQVYWEGTDENGGGNGVWAIDERGEACSGWVAYVAALK